MKILDMVYFEGSPLRLKTESVSNVSVCGIHTIWLVCNRYKHPEGKRNVS